MSVLVRPIAVALALLAAGAAQAGTCPRPGTLGVSRVLPVEVGADGLFVGTKSYPDTLPLADHEIVLSFDDGPAGKTTDAVLAALEAECVKATFFVVGEMAAAHPEQLRRMAAAGHTIGHHTMTHTILTKVPFERGEADVETGWQTVDRILTGTAGDRPKTPFFRYPGFAATKPLDAWLTERRVAVFGADFWGSDWNKSTPEALLALTLSRIEARGRGILLLHDTHDYTAAMVPGLLAALKAKGWRVVQIVPAPPPATGG
ncbi:MAG: polysaccharide deacetylase family protein [Phyllobacteriaceae bacterium]|nr:polysaccharide deacetylase family protein [Phyllobacteriaceae bacterium]